MEATPMQALPQALRQAHDLEPHCTLFDPSLARKLSTGSEPLDRLLAGGLPPGETVEVYGQRSGGRFSMALTALAMATAGGRCAALVDLGDGLDPQSAAAVGVDLGRLLWVRPRRLDQALASAEALLASGVPLVVVDLGIPPIPGGRGDEDAWRRLARTAREQGVTLWISSPFRVAAEAAGVAVEAFEPSVAWRRHGATARILGGLSSRLELRSGATKDPTRDAGPETLTVRTSDALAADAGEGDGDGVRILEFPTLGALRRGEGRGEERAIA
jgi:recA bacterial DNA recombination protein